MAKVRAEADKEDEKEKQDEEKEGDEEPEPEAEAEPEHPAYILADDDHSETCRARDGEGQEGQR